MSKYIGKDLPAFTLIELLVVISIIGMLSSVVLSSLNGARNKAADASVRQQLSSMRAAAALLYENTGSYNDLCDTTTDTGRMYRAAYENSAKTANGGRCVSSTKSASKCLNNISVVTCANGEDATNKWAAVLELKTGGFFCVNYNGISRYQTSRVVDTNPVEVDC